MMQVMAESDKLRLRADIMDLEEILDEVDNEEFINVGYAAINSMKKILMLEE